MMESLTKLVIVKLKNTFFEKKLLKEKTKLQTFDFVKNTTFRFEKSKERKNSAKFHPNPKSL